MCRTIRADVRHTGFFATSIRCFREGLVKDSTEDLRNRDLLSLNRRPRDFTTTPMRARIERRNRKCPSRLAIRFSSAATHLKIRTADDFRGYSSGRHQGHQPAIRRRYSGVGSGCIADTTTRRWRSSPGSRLRLGYFGHHCTTMITVAVPPSSCLQHINQPYQML